MEASWSFPGAFLELSWSFPGAFLEPWRQAFLELNTDVGPSSGCCMSQRGNRMFSEAAKRLRARVSVCVCSVRRLRLPTAGVVYCNSTVVYL
jgi:hypothetical protein